MSDLVAEVVPAPVLRDRVREMGRQITQDYAGREPILVGLLTAGVPFLADLGRAVDLAVEFDFLAVTSFGDGGRIRIAADTETPLTGRDVIVVDVLTDTGLTLASVLRLLEARQCRSISTVTLFDKAPRRIAHVPLDYRGFEVGDEFLIGYGLDYAGWFRNLPAVHAVLDLEALTSDVAGFGRAAFGWMSDRLSL